MLLGLGRTRILNLDSKAVKVILYFFFLRWNGREPFFHSLIEHIDDIFYKSFSIGKFNFSANNLHFIKFICSLASSYYNLDNFI